MSTLDGLRVGLVGPLAPPAGGMAMQTLQLAELLRGSGVAVTLVQTNVLYRPAFVGRVPVLRALARLLPYLLALWRAAGRSDLCHVMANSGWSWHLFAAPAVWIARLRRVPVVVNYRGGDAEAFLAQQARLVRWSLHCAAAVIVPSGFLQDVFARHGIPTEIVPNIVDLDRFQPADGADSKPPHVFVARNLEPIYGIETAISAFAKVLATRRDVIMTIAGTGPQAPALQRQVADLGLQDRIRFAGHMDRDTVAETLRASTVALNPSRVDNMPNSVLEALASGVPVISTRVGGVPYVVRDGETALLVPADDTDAMARAILRVISDQPLARRLAEAGLREVQRYSWINVEPLWTAVYRRAMAPAVSLKTCTRD